jgi:glycosyltransferase involved in cell wall biosynthesis
VSVIIIFFNAARFFAEAIDSVLAQEYRDFELLLVDDGSSDAGTDIAKDYERRFAERIRYLEHPGHANRGMSATRNLGVDAARGELVAFLDSDDRWVPNKLREQVEVLDRHPNVDAVCGTARYWRSWEGREDRLVPSGHVHNRPVRPPEAILAVYPLGSANAPCPSDLLIRRSALLAIGGFEESFTGMYEDQAFLTKLYLERTIYFSDKVWIDYRLHDQSCCAQVRRAGRHRDTRRQFLEWFKGHLAKSRYRRDPRIKMALTKAQLRHRFPYAARMFELPKRIIRRLRAFAAHPAAGA